MPDTAKRRVTSIRMEDSRTVLRTAPCDEVSLDVGVHTMARTIFLHDPPRPEELERAIDVVEASLMAAHLPHEEGGLLICADDMLYVLPGLQEGGSQLSRDGVEALFQALASASLARRPAAVLSLGGAGQAALLILRECMHHLGYDTIARL